MKKDVRKKFYLKNRSNIIRIMDQEEQIIEKYESMNKKFHKKTCRIRGTVYPEVEEALILWMKQMRSNKIPLSGDLIKCKANEFAKKMNIDK